jgi:hypothetical protein
MTFSHDDANARLLDLVYGEAGPAEREALEAHVATCASCTADLASLGDTRAKLRGALEDAPVPARAHARILEAATLAAAPIAAAASSAGAVASRAAAAIGPAAAAPAPARQAPPAPARPSFWQVLRGKWTLPTFATVGAVAVVVVASKVFLEPEHTMQVGREIATAPPPAPEPAAAKPAEELEKVAASNEPALEPPAPNAPHRPPLRFGPGGIGGGPLGALRNSHGGRPDTSGSGLSGALSRHAASSAGGDELGGVRGGSTGRGLGVAPAAPLPAKSAPLDDLLEGSLSRKAPPADEERARGKAEAANEAAAHRRDYAPPPSGWKGGAGPGAAAPAPSPPPPPAAVASRSAPAAQPAMRKKAAASLDDDFRGNVPSGSLEADEAVESEAAAPKAKLAKKPSSPPSADKPSVAAGVPASREKAIAPAPVAQAAPMESPSRSYEKAERLQDKDVADGPAGRKESKQDAGSPEALARRADQLFVAGRWSEAAAAYRDLLRRYPDADLAPRWRSRLAQAQLAAKDAPTAKAAKAASSKANAAPAEAAPAK